MPALPETAGARSTGPLLPIRLAIPESVSFKQILDLFKTAVVAANKHKKASVPSALSALELPVSALAEMTKTVMVSESLHSPADPAPAAEILFRIGHSGDRISIEAEHRTRLHSGAAVDRILAHLETLLGRAFAAPAADLAQVDILSAGEAERILAGFSAGAHADFPSETSIQAAFEAKAARFPDRVALVWRSGSEWHSLTYAQVNADANRIAAQLIAAGVRQESLVGISGPRGFELVAGLLGILKAGGAYLPLPETLPEERRALMLRDSGCGWLLAPDHVPAPEGWAGKSLSWRSPPAMPDPGNPFPQGDCRQRLAYAMYTSGSTGTPKGVMVQQGGVLNLLQSMEARYPMGPEDVFLGKTSFAFDISVAELFGWFMGHGRLLILEEGAEKDPQAIAGMLADGCVTHLNFVPSMLQVFLAALGRKLEPLARTVKWVMVAGEAVPAALINQYDSLGLPASLENLYGPTECSIYATGCPLRGLGQDGLVPIGSPLENLQAYVLDARLRPVPVGVFGDLFLGGAGLCRGYLGRPGLTAAAFLPNPFQAGTRMYRTGDLTRWGQDGWLDFLGRSDDQVKVRGFRIEPGEVEAALVAFPGLRQAAVVVKPDGHGNAVLCGYYLADADFPPRDLAEFLALRLPEYMIPSRFTRLERFPLGATGKLLRRSLPDPAQSAASGGVAAASVTGAWEEGLLPLWRKALGAPEASPHGTFFEAGGHSLHAVMLITEIEKVFRVEVPLRAFFRQPTLAALAERIREARSTEWKRIAPAPRLDVYPISSAQRRIYALHLLNPDSLAYNMPWALAVQGRFDIEALCKAFRTITERHEILRTSFEMRDGKPVQRIHAHAEPSFELYEGRNRSLAEWCSEFIRSFDIGKPGLLRMAVIRNSDTDHFFLFDMHHIISDAVSGEILLKEVREILAGNALPALSLQYRDFAYWQTGIREAVEIQEQKRFWMDLYREPVKIAEFPADNPRPSVRTVSGARIRGELPEALSAGVGECSRRASSTPFLTLLAAFSFTLYKYTGQDDLVLGTTATGRNFPGGGDMIGMFANTLALRLAIDADKSFIEMIKDTQDCFLGAYENQDFQFDDLVEAMNLKREASRHPLFDIIFSFREAETAPVWPEGLTVRALDPDYGTAKFDLLLDCRWDNGKVEYFLEYASELFERAGMERFLAYFQAVLEAALADPEGRLSAIRIQPASAPERAQGRASIIRDFAAEAVPVHLRFEEAARRHPTAIAIACGKEGDVSYSELSALSSRLAARLRSHGVAPGDRVGIMATRTPEDIIALLAILKAGAAFVPIDAEAPEDRRAFILADCGASVLISAGAVPGFTGLLLDPRQSGSAAHDAPPHACAPSDAAYVLYTSGTTGRPKGVVVEHHCLENYARWAAENYLDGARACFPYFTSLAFDLTLTSIFVPLITGNCIRVLSGATSQDLAIAAFQEPGIQAIKATPAHLRMLRFLDKVNPDLEILIIGGEDLDSRLAGETIKRLKPGARIFNEYGPTETTVGCMIHRFDPGSDVRPSVPIGVAAPNFRIYLLDREGQPVQRGVTGEIFISGEGVARGYWQRQSEDEKRFLPDPFHPGSRMYRSGDLARELPNGLLEFIGRKDQQVKIRGYRIETSEVEARLRAHPGIEDCLVLCRNVGADSEARLCAYYIAAGDVSESALRGSLALALPAYMIPDFFVKLPRFPLTHNGKIDMAALPEANPSALESACEPISGPLETALAEAWRSILKIDSLGARDNFFSLGGDSIKAIQMSALLRDKGWWLELGEMFGNPVLRDMAGRLKGLEEKVEDGGFEAGQGELTPIQLWFFETLGGNANHYNQCILLHQPEGYSLAHLEKALAQIAERHDAFRSAFRFSPEGYRRQVASSQAGWVFSVRSLPLKGDLAKSLEAAAEEAQKGFAIADGALASATVFHSASGDFLFLCIHHLAIDGISWRILLEELSSTYARLLEGKSAPILWKSASYGQWAFRLRAFAESGAITRAECGYWREIDRMGAALPRLAATARSGNRRPAMSLDTSLEAGLSAKLSRDCGRPYATDVNELLLAALASALGRWRDAQGFYVCLEGHGREDILGNLDVSRTVGWFTSRFPAILAAEPGAKLGRHIKNIKEQVRGIPGKGIGYGLARYLAPEPTRWTPDAEPDIDFNYLGQLDSGAFPALGAPSRLSTGRAVGEELHRPGVLCIDAIMAEGGLHARFTFSETDFPVGDIQGLASLYLEELERVVLHCSQATVREPTPSDYCAIPMRQEELDSILAAVRGLSGSAESLKRIHPLSPMQSAMLFSHRLQGDPSAYHVQIGFSVRGNVKEGHVRQAIGTLAERHESLRTFFPDGAGGRPLQAILKVREPGYHCEDLSGLDAGAAEERIRAACAQNKIKGFDLEKDPLLRLSVFRLGADRLRLVWEFHHIILDGWSLGMLLQEFLKLIGSEEASLPPPVSIGRYLDWHAKRDQTRAIAFWKEYLAGAPASSRFPHDAASGGGGYLPGSAMLEFEPGLSGRLEALCRENQVTMNSCFQILWGLLLARHAGREDVVFGTVVSGRPPELQGSTAMIGLFINTVPVRIRFQEGVPLAKLMQSLHGGSAALQENGVLPLAELHAQCGLDRRFLNHVVVVENYPLSREMTDVAGLIASGLAISDVEVDEHTSYDLDVVLIPGDPIRVKFAYNRNAIRETAIAGAMEQLHDLARQFARNPFLSFDRLLWEPGIGATHPRSDLSLPVPAASSAIGSPRAWEAPATGMEQALAVLWEQVLGIPGVSRNHDFFRLGGHSLKAMELANKVRSELGVELPLARIFNTSTLAEMALFLGGAREAALADLSPVASRAYYPLSSAQRRLFVIESLGNAGIGYNTPGAVWVEGPLDPQRMQWAIRSLVQRHEILRTSLRVEAGVPVQEVHAEAEVRIESLSGREDGREALMIPDSVVQAAVAAFVRPFQLGTVPLFRIGLLPWRKQGGLLVFDMHHAITDGISSGILIGEFARLYAGDILPPLALQYRDYACWQARWMESDEMLRQEAYWLGKFPGALPGVTLPTDFPRPFIMDQKGGTIRFRFDSGVTSGLRHLAGENRATLGMTLMALFNVLLSRYTGQDDIVVGTAVAGRPHAGLEGLIGVFINILPIRTRIDQNLTFPEFLGEVRGNLLEAYGNQDFPFERLVEKLNAGGGMGGNPLFSVMFTMQNFEQPEIAIPGLKFTPLALDGRVTHGDLNLMAQESSGGIDFLLEYSTSLFRRATVAKVGAQLERIAKQVLGEIPARLADLEILADSETESLLTSLGGKEAGISSPASQADGRESGDNISADFNWKGEGE